MHRYWSYENATADYLLGRCGRHNPSGIDTDDLDRMVEDWFPEGDRDQKSALRLAVQHRFCVLSGGPGTGKTYTLAKIILLLNALAGDAPVRIKLAAPTGKAAARLQEAIEASLLKMEKSAGRAVNGTLEKAQTLHRLLAIDLRTGRSRFNEHTPLAADAVIVDEASMVDLSMMARLITALPPKVRLILSGDKDQLASVEAGAVLGDICYGVHQGAGTGQGDGPGLDEHIVLLRRNFRFERRSGIHDLCQSINRGDSEATAGILADPAYEGVALHPVDGPGDVADLLAGEIRQIIAPWFAEKDPGRMLDNLAGFKILTVVRHGPYGVREMNLLVDRVLARMDLIPAQRIVETHMYPGWYPGRPVMVTRNDYHHALFNGDMGVAVAAGEEAQRKLQVVFNDARKGLRSFSPHQLPAHETAYATTVHKSQGSEFHRVVLVLPDQDIPLLTRELLYTAVTRARGSVAVIGKADLLAVAVKRRTRRTSGLKDKLWPSG
jgi:exodeoxyribonuclease V alpha subunit